jgi:hypothetical protein
MVLFNAKQSAQYVGVEHLVAFNQVGGIIVAWKLVRLRRAISGTHNGGRTRREGNNSDRRIYAPRPQSPQQDAGTRRPRIDRPVPIKPNCFSGKPSVRMDVWVAILVAFSRSCKRIHVRY